MLDDGWIEVVLVVVVVVVVVDREERERERERRERERKRERERRWRREREERSRRTPRSSAILSRNPPAHRGLRTSPRPRRKGRSSIALLSHLSDGEVKKAVAPGYISRSRPASRVATAVPKSS